MVCQMGFLKISRRTSIFESKYLFCLFIILILCLIDGVFTIHLIKKGAWEANPVMRVALSVSHEFFFLIKYFLTAGGLIILLKFGDRRVFKFLRVEELACGLVILYEGLIIYEISIYHLVK